MSKNCVFQLFILLSFALVINSCRSEAPRPNQSGDASWIGEGIVWPGNMYEDALFQTRVGWTLPQSFQPPDWEEIERRVKVFADMGVNLIPAWYYSGFGFRAEAFKLEWSRRLGEIAHRHGLKLWLRIDCNTLVYETFFVEEPRAKTWIQVDAAGNPILLTYEYKHFWRMRPCFSNDEFLKWYMEKPIRAAVVDAGVDFIFLDNFNLNPEPESCHCPWCTRKFREFITDRYSPEERIRKFGFADMSEVIPPLWNRRNPPDRIEVIRDPIVQEWIDFRCATMTGTIKRVVDYVKNLNPAVAVMQNSHGILGLNRPFQHGVYHPDILPHTEVMMTEELFWADYTQDERLVTKIRTYKMAHLFDNLVFTRGNQTEQEMAEGLAFNGSIGNIQPYVHSQGQYKQWNDFDPNVLRYLGFYLKHRDLYRDTRTVADVAVLRSYPSMAYIVNRTHVSTCMLEQSLIADHIPWTPIFDRHLRDLPEYKVLILADQEILSDENLELIRSYVQGGGGLVATEATSLVNTWSEQRPDFGLADLFGIHFDGYQNIYNQYIGMGSAVATRREIGAGRVAYFPHIERPPNLERSMLTSLPLPVNHGSLMKATRWVSGDRFSLGVEAPPWVVTELRRQKSSGRTLVHLVNYKKNTTATGIKLDVELPAGMRATRVWMVSPDFDGTRELNFRGKDRVNITVDRMAVYNVIVIESAT